MPCRVEANTDRLLQLFDDCDVRGTFFVLGWVAKHYPQLVRRIADAGHELASHGYWHQLVYSLSPDEFRQDIRDSREAIGEASGVTVTAYRAPSFSITKKSIWALDVLAEEGFTIDSSIFPIRHDRYGMPDARPEIHIARDRTRSDHRNPTLRLADPARERADRRRLFSAVPVVVDHTSHPRRPSRRSPRHAVHPSLGNRPRPTASQRSRPAKPLPSLRRPPPNRAAITPAPFQPTIRPNGRGVGEVDSRQ